MILNSLILPLAQHFPQTNKYATRRQIWILQQILCVSLAGLEAIAQAYERLVKNIRQIEHSRHRIRFNFLVNLLAGLVAYIIRRILP